MPSDANGVFSLVSGYLAVTGETIQASQHNPVLEDIASSMSARLMRSGVAPMTGPLKIADGSVGSPALTFNTATSTGFYKTTNGIGVSVNGTKVAEFTSSGASRMIGELIPWALVSPPAGWVLAYGQTLSRTTYADLWSIAQGEIAGGNVFFNNGDGSTTFGIGDLRGRAIAGKDDMGGSAASRLTSSYFGTLATVLGAGGGGENWTLSQAQLPVTTLTFTGLQQSWPSSQSSIPVNTGVSNINADFITPDSSFPSLGSISSKIDTLVTPSGTISSFGSGAPHRTVQPTLICNYILYAGA